MSKKQKQQKKKRAPRKCPKCGTTKNLTVAVKCVPDARYLIGGRVDWDNDSAAECAGGCGFIGKVADFL
jgi:hypothetical protein